MHDIDSESEENMMSDRDYSINTKPNMREGASSSFFKKKVLLSPKDIDQEARRKLTLGHKSKNSID